MFFHPRSQEVPLQFSLFLLNKTDVRRSIKINSFIKKNGIQRKTDISALKISSDRELIAKLAKMCK